MTSVTTDVLLALFGLVGGIGITAIGPGGVLPTIALFLLTPLAPAQVAGTAIVTHVATGVAGSAAYVRSGQLRERHTRRVAGLLAGVAVVGTPVGVLLNSLVSARWFGVVLGVFAVVVAALVVLRRPVAGREPATGSILAIGAGVAVAAGLVGVGGPMLTVPVLVVVGLPMLEALAAAQVQSVVIATAGAVGYLLPGSIDWRLAAVVGVPELAGVVIGWKIAHALPTKRLRIALVVALVAVAPYLVLHG
ncbi:sulfite exporter TauE/SafE family protein [Amycolatopsis sp. DSM 110486]|uniref:sulfite exporter TauE/SafE family protein n=1 Tax=Amycolatopsis sp. DSM 110486 TaxID=2865832 RepID=UPI001C69EB36|nr:sulfite exporter TauE/SafE family protein [Amycolatopsis sp. DSM 110486]QYN17929.1 sulfite exporter TauE/SafE family protein [Amycolatopsis sp. DSM 110486]